VSLVLEALRRVDKPNDKTGSIGVAVSAYRPARPRRSLALPLLLGLATGAALLFPSRLRPTNPSGSSTAATVKNSVAVVGEPPLVTAPAGLPPGKPMVSTPEFRPGLSANETPALRPGSTAPAVSATRRHLPRRPEREGSTDSGLAPSVSLTLQAISERDSAPIAIINDQLVKEGDLIGRTRILRIGSDSVDVLLESGKRETVRFAPPPLNSSPSAEPR
jgi:hypothetical protein